jgi:hypothetical protein
MYHPIAGNETHLAPLLFWPLILLTGWLYWRGRRVMLNRTRGLASSIGWRDGAFVAHR